MSEHAPELPGLGGGAGALPLAGMIGGLIQPAEAWLGSALDRSVGPRKQLLRAENALLLMAEAAAQWDPQCRPTQAQLYPPQSWLPARWVLDAVLAHWVIDRCTPPIDHTRPPLAEGIPTATLVRGVRDMLEDPTFPAPAALANAAMELAVELLEPHSVAGVGRAVPDRALRRREAADALGLVFRAPRD